MYSKKPAPPQAPMPMILNSVNLTQNRYGCPFDWFRLIMTANPASIYSLSSICVMASFARRRRLPCAVSLDGTISKCAIVISRWVKSSKLLITNYRLDDRYQLRQSRFSLQRWDLFTLFFEIDAFGSAHAESSEIIEDHIVISKASRARSASNTLFTTWEMAPVLALRAAKQRSSWRQDFVAVNAWFWTASGPGSLWETSCRSGSNSWKYNQKQRSTWRHPCGYMTKTAEFMTFCLNPPLKMGILINSQYSEFIENLNYHHGSVIRRAHLIFSMPGWIGIRLKNGFLIVLF